MRVWARAFSLQMNPGDSEDRMDVWFGEKKRESDAEDVKDIHTHIHKRRYVHRRAHTH